MVCPNCQTVNLDDAHFCIACGKPLPRTCRNCDALNPPEARFCNQCGAPLASTSPAISSPSASIFGQKAANRVPAPRDGTAGVARSQRGTTQAKPQDRGQAVAEETAEHEEERRVVTILFADLTSSTSLADTMDPEDVRTLLGGFFTTISREIHRHGGTVEKYIGDAVMAVFGLPFAHEDDPVRAVRAALDMQTALRFFNEERLAVDPAAVELQMRIGINSGEVVAASGATDGRDFLVTGDPVNVAARLQQTAAPSTILVGPRTYRGTTGAVIYRALPPISLRGKSRPVRVWEALAMVDQGAAPMPRPRGVQGLRAPLIGRDVELNLLRTLYARVSGEHRPHLVTIVGVPGVGKTRLAHEFVNEVTEVVGVAEMPRVLEGRCPQYGEAITYWALAEMLRSLCDFTALDAPEAARAKLLDCVRDILSTAERPEDPEVLAAYLGHTIGIESPERRQALLPSDAQQLQDGLMRSWRVFFEALATKRPLLVLVDDIHWADGVLLDLLEYAATRTSGVPLLLLCAARPQLLERRPGWGGGKRNYVTIGLEALSTADAYELVRSLLPGNEVPELLRRGITRKAEGNPFYAEEIVRMLVDRGILISTGARPASWRIAPEWESSKEVEDPAIPDTVQGVLAARLDLLSPRERDVLQHAAVIGRYFWPGILRGLHPHISDTLDDMLYTLQEKDLIAESDRQEASVAPAGEPLYSFTHALTREVTYGTIPRSRRAREHERVAEWLEQLAHGREAEFADLIAQHYREYYVQANLAVSPTSARRRLVRNKVARYLTLAGDQAATRHAAGKAERYYSNALTMLEEDAFADDVPRRIALLMKRGDARWLQVRGDGAWTDYRDALRLWSAYSTFTVDPVDPAAGQHEHHNTSRSGTHERAASTIVAGAANAATDHSPSESGSRFATVALSAPVAADGTAAALADTPITDASLIALPLDWPTIGLRLYRLIVQLPTRYPSLFQQPPSHEELLPYLQEGLRLAEELGQRDTLEGAALLTAKSFFWWSWGERRGQTELLDAMRSAREAVRISESLDDARSASEALDALGNVQTVTADLQGNLESQTRRLHWARRLDDVNELVDIYTEVCIAHTLVGEYATGEERGQHALELADAADADPLRARALRVLVNCTFEHDRWADTVRLGRQLQTLSTHVDLAHSQHERWAFIVLAVAHARMGDREAAERIEQRLNQVAELTPVQFLELSKARLALARGATKEARQILLAALDVRSGRLAMPMLLAELAELGARSGDRDFYDRFATQALELGWRSGARKAQAQAIRARGIMAAATGDWDDAQYDLESALKRYQQLDTSWEEARTHYALAGFYRRRASDGDAASTQQELARAIALFESIDAVRDTARARAALAGSDVRLP